MVNEPDEVKPRAYSGGEPGNESSDPQTEAPEQPEDPSSEPDPDPSPRKDRPDDTAAPGSEPAEVDEGSGPDQPDPAASNDLTRPKDGSEDRPETEEAGGTSEQPPEANSGVEEYTDTYQAEAEYTDPSYSPDRGPQRETGTSEEAPTDTEEPPPASRGRRQARRARSEPSEEETSEGEEDDGGGPVKTFLEHLEDLRWVIIRCVASLAIAMVVCLVAGNKIVDLLMDPLHRAQQLTQRKSKAFVLIEMGTNKMALNLNTDHFGSYSLKDTNAMKFVVTPIRVGTNTFLGLVPAPLDPAEIPPVNMIELKTLGPVSPFVVALKIALFGGLGLASPFILLFIGQFVVPALRKKEKKYLYRAVAIGSLLFCSGVLFCYFLMLQIALNAAVQFSKWMGFGADIWRAEDYIGFVVKFLLGMGLSFELPVVLLTLVKLELLDYERMNKFRPFWVVMNLALAAVLTPPDVVSQLLMAIPLQLLFELSVLIAWYWHRRDQKRAAAEGLAS